MLNRYPLWKNLLILFIVVLGLLYSAPNLYPDDEAILINNENLEISEADIAVVETALEAAQIDFFGVVSDENSMQFRFEDVEDQFRAKTVIEQALTDDYIVALNLRQQPRLDAGHRCRQNESRAGSAGRRTLSDGSGHGSGS